MKPYNICSALVSYRPCRMVTRMEDIDAEDHKPMVTLDVVNVCNCHSLDVSNDYASSYVPLLLVVVALNDVSLIGMDMPPLALV